ncbi:NAD(P)-dependent oxidoreductase [Flavobacterium sp. LC2016-01]|uniref:NAD(P)-dependent oxidoreductase n=1 Tax=Flavobacterium sp. LC2016-01 TaxID=2675876 RepID=UPI0018AC902B|nr:NAD(P)-dependent oxidoreductase [Flavobacterium sp. LC2016-01]
MKIAITESEHFSPKGLEKLSEIGSVKLLDCKSEQQLISECIDASVIFIRLKFKISSSIIDQLPNLKYILSATTGTDHIDEDYFASKGGRIVTLKGETEFLESIPSTAEHTWALILSLIKKVPFAFDDVKLGNWNRDGFKNNNLKGKNIAVLGMGRVGKQVAHIASAFGMKIGFYDVLSFESIYERFETPEALFSWADIVTIHIPYTTENDGFINENLLDCLKKEACVINTSRGRVWNENVIAKKLENGLIKGIATDVLCNEFHREDEKNELVTLAKKGLDIVITPHIAGATFESMAMTEEFIVEKFLKK